MGKKRAGASFLAIIMLAVFNSVSSAGTMVYGPKEYSRAEDVNQTLTDNFVASPGNNYKLVFYNNENIKPNTFLWDQLQIKVNGQDVYGATCFSILQYKVERPLVLKGENTLEIKLKGAKGCSPLTLQIEAEPVPQPKAKAPAKSPVIARSEETKQSKGSLDTDPLYSYDVMGNRTKMTDPVGTTIYSYDILDRLIKITNPRGQVTRYTYNAIGQRTGITYPNGMTAGYTYDAAGQLLTLVYKMGANTIASFSYTYDYKGNRITMTDEYGTHNYTYDKVNQLTQAIHPQANNPTENYAYDPVGNRLGIYNVYNAGNRLLEDGNYLYSYNRDGNTVLKQDKISGKVTRYTYNAIRELTDVKKYATATDTTPITSARYYYDGLRRRIAKRVNGTLTRYVYSNEAIIQELNESGTQIAYYTQGPGIDEPISVERNGITYYYIADGLGSIAKLVDAAGNVVNKYVYDSFGNIMEQTGIVTNYYTYTGREYDSESGLYYYRMRYYDPMIGRFMNHDPMGLSQGVNLYAYAKNNPVNFADSFGLWSPGVHYDLTYDAAVGLWGGNNAAQMASYTKNVDDKYNDIWWWNKGKSANAKWHYYADTKDASVNLIVDQFRQAYDRYRYTNNMSKVLMLLGEGVHPLQDKWAHAAYGIKSTDSLIWHGRDILPEGWASTYYQADVQTSAALEIFYLATHSPVYSLGILDEIRDLAGSGIK